MYTAGRRGSARSTYLPAPYKALSSQELLTMPPAKPSLLVFTLDPARECARRRLLPARFEGLGRRLLRRSLDSALAAGAASGCRLEVSSPEPLALGDRARWVEQRGRGFGNRFRHALRGARERASGPLLVVGSDVPGLTREHIDDALERLAEAPDRVVLGPSPDGGFYLLAANRSLDAELAEVRWCRRDTLRSLIAVLRSRGVDVCLIAPLEDLDRPQDLQSWLARGLARTGRADWLLLRLRLRRLFAELCRPLAATVLGSPRPALALAPSGRAPPR